MQCEKCASASWPRLTALSREHDKLKKSSGDARLGAVKDTWQEINFSCALGDGWVCACSLFLFCFGKAYTLNGFDMA